MNVALRRRMTVEEFLAWEERQPERWEFDGFQPVAMVGASLRHNRIALNVASELRQRLRGGPCSAYIEGVKIEAAGSIRYPDVLVSCSATPDSATVASHPVVVFEVLSPSTATTDATVKNGEYQATPSIMRYVMLSQDAVALTVHERRGEDWLSRTITDPEVSLDMPEIGVSVPVAAFYEGVGFEP